MEKSQKSLDAEAKANRNSIVTKKEDLKRVLEKLKAVEEKWISDQITRDTYDRWTSNYNAEIFPIKYKICY